jgi:hypothetical protein
VADRISETASKKRRHFYLGMTEPSCFCGVRRGCRESILRSSAGSRYFYPVIPAKTKNHSPRRHGEHGEKPIQKH